MRTYKVALSETVQVFQQENHSQPVPILIENQLPITKLLLYHQDILKTAIFLMAYLFHFLRQDKWHKQFHPFFV